MTHRLIINDSGYFETCGLNVLVFNNFYDKTFKDAKMSGIELIHHEVRTVTNGDVRLEPTPGQWAPVPTLIDRKVNPKSESIDVILSYPDYAFTYSIKVKTHEDGVLIRVHLEKPLPGELKNITGFNLEFLPSAFFEKAYVMDDTIGFFPLYPCGPTKTNENMTMPATFSSGRKFIAAPEDPGCRIMITSDMNELFLYDGRNQAQNGWFVLRSPIPENKTGTVVEWFLTASTIPDWVRKPVIAHSQAGYHPDQTKKAVIELDKNDKPLPSARLLKVSENGELLEKYTGNTDNWGRYLRYNYITFDFSSVKEPGLYILEYGDVRTAVFGIRADVYENVWYPTLDVFFPVQMDHMRVREAYRVWHGLPHMDDARQAPLNHEHFDLYAQGPVTDTRYEPGEHIPGLNVGGWFDAGDYDIRTQTQFYTVMDLIYTWEDFRLVRDETTINQKEKYTLIHVPDGVPDLLQQIEHGTLALLAQHRAVGHAICGIIEPDIEQYTHLGDASTKTDNLIYNPGFREGESDTTYGSKPDDRWAFTSKSTPLNYGSIAALSAASRALRDYNDELARECLSTAVRVWDEEQTHEPDMFQHGNTTGGMLVQEEFKAAVELFISTKKDMYAERIYTLLPSIQKAFHFSAISAIRVLPYMGKEYENKIKSMVIGYFEYYKKYQDENPFGVYIIKGKWAGNMVVLRIAMTNYMLYRAFPDSIDPENFLSGLNYIFGCHPGSDISFVSGVGTISKKVAYGVNRAEFSYIAGGVVPGVLIINPDFPENKEDWPFLWGENECVIGGCASYIFLSGAAQKLLEDE